MLHCTCHLHCKGEILKNRFHEILYISGYSVDFTRQEKICFAMVRPAITV